MGDFIYGPVPSRRLGRSLGVDLLVPKSCTMNCIYCQIGSTEPLPPIRRRFVDPDRVEAELEEAVRIQPKIDYITLSGSGEPTLSSDTGRIIRFAKSLNASPVCVLTNGTLLYDEKVREELAAADVVIPNLDSADKRTFQIVNRPHDDISFERFIDGLMLFSNGFAGKMFLEIVLIRRENDSDGHLKRLAKLVESIRPAGVWIGTVTRPPAEAGARPVDDTILEKARDIIGGSARIITAFTGEEIEGLHKRLTGEVLSILMRRPETPEAIAKSLGANQNDILKAIASLYEKRMITQRRVAGETYYDYAR